MSSNANSSESKLNPASETHTETEENDRRGWRFHAAFACLCLVNLICAIDGTALSVSLPIISQKLGGTAIEAFWSAISFLLTSTVFQPTWALFSHIFGRKPLILAALMLFTIGAIVCSLANTFTVLLLGRSIQGVGGGGIIALTYVIVTDLVTLRERGKWFGLISLQWAIGAVSGPILGGAFAQKVSWRWIFWTNLPFCGLAFAMIPLFLRLHFQRRPFLSQLKRVDWVGSAIFIASTTSFLVPLSWGGVLYPWNHWRTLVPLSVGACGLLVFVVYEQLVPSEPLIRGSMFRSRTALVSYFGTVLHGAIVWSILYYLPLYYEAARSMSPIMSGVALFPQTFTVAPASLIVGVMITRLGRYRWAIWAGWSLATLGCSLLTLLTASTPTHSWILLNLVSGLGLGMLFSAMSFATQAPASNADLPFAAALFSFFRALGQALGVAMGGVVFQNRMARNLAAQPQLAPFAGEYSADASALVELLASLPREKVEMKGQLVQAYVDALRVVWATMAALAGLGLLSSLGTQEISLDRALETEQGWLGGPRTRVGAGAGAGGDEGEDAEKSRHGVHQASARPSSSRSGVS